MRIRLKPDSASEAIELELQRRGPSGDEFAVRFGAVQHDAEITERGGQGWMRVGDRIVRFGATRIGGRVEVWIGGRVYGFQMEARVNRRTQAGVHPITAREIAAPMPGTILKINIDPGESFEAHTPLIIMESMKMEMALSAPSAGRVESVHCQTGELVHMGQVLITLTAPESVSVA